MELDVNALPVEATQKIAPFLDEVGIESTSESAIRRKKNHGRLVHFRRLAQKRKTLCQIGRIESRDYFRETIGVGTRCLHAILRSFHFRSGDHLESTRDLARVLN